MCAAATSRRRKSVVKSVAVTAHAHSSAFAYSGWREWRRSWASCGQRVYCTTAGTRGTPNDTIPRALRTTTAARNTRAVNATWPWGCGSERCARRPRVCVMVARAPEWAMRAQHARHACTASYGGTRAEPPTRAPHLGQLSGPTAAARQMKGQVLVRAGSLTSRRTRAYPRLGSTVAGACATATQSQPLTCCQHPPTHLPSVGQHSTQTCVPFKVSTCTGTTHHCVHTTHRPGRQRYVCVRQGCRRLTCPARSAECSHACVQRASSERGRQRCACADHCATAPRSRFGPVACRRRTIPSNVGQMSIRRHMADPPLRSRFHL